MKKTKKKKKDPLVEIARSFSYKKNLGDYQSADFFCSAKSECKNSESVVVSEKMYAFCKQEVAKSLNSFMKERNKAPEPQSEPVVQTAEPSAPLKQTGSVLDGTAMYNEHYPANKYPTKETAQSRARVTQKYEGLGSSVVHGEMEEHNQQFNKGAEEALAKRQQ